MKFERFDIDGPVLVTPVRIGDSRGFFSESFRADKFEAEIGPTRFVQDNQSLSVVRGTIRGLHYQKAPHAQGKLIRVLRGAVFDVAVDIRKQSKTFGRHVAVELSSDNGQQLWVPPGFLHGFCTLCDNVEVMYKVTDYYSPACDAAVRWNDPDIGIRWPIAEAEAQLSAKDQTAPWLRDISPM
ncbi:MAG TPA: dTDP-4-dehydrorhamnose 3,5-epimerase [Beijerinckiaceae bacterium]|nr:dTDP-4-dehydrorhamnose 3,5-epimerase [Beijerinckiaceae bacterium]